MRPAIGPAVPLRAGPLFRRLPQLTRLGHESDSRYGWPRLRPARARPPTTPAEGVLTAGGPLSRSPATPSELPVYLRRSPSLASLVYGIARIGLRLRGGVFTEQAGNFFIAQRG